MCKKVVLIVAVYSLLFLMIFIQKTKPEVYRFETYIVEPGDTSWTIANKYNVANKDIRELVYFIGLDNDIKPGYIYPGQEIKIRIYETR